MIFKRMVGKKQNKKGWGLHTQAQGPVSCATSTEARPPGAPFSGEIHRVHTKGAPKSRIAVR